MTTFQILEQPAHHRAHASRVLDQMVFFVDGNRRQRCGAREWMTVVSQATVKNILLKVICDLASHADCAQLHVSARQTFRHRDQIGNDFPVIDREPLARATKPGHHFVSDQKYPVLVAQITQALHVTVGRNEYSICSDNRFDNQRGDRLCSFELEHLFSAREYVFRCVPTFLNTVIEIRYAKHSRNTGFRGPATWITGERQRSCSTAVIATITRADLVTTGIKSRDTDRVFIRLSAAVGEEEHVYIARRQFG